jgi:predicted nucleotide-binding protein (sugar kinase/HSP70/actin superfamily)
VAGGTDTGAGIGADSQTMDKSGNGKTTRAAAEAAAATLGAVPKPVGAMSLGSSPIDKEADLRSRTTFLPRMPYGGSRMLAASFRSIGIDTAVVPESDSRTLELGGKYTSGDECYPQRIVLGDFMKLLEDDKLDPKKTAFLLPTANGPCRFGQYSALVRRILDDQGYQDVTMMSFTSADGYAGIGAQAGEVIRTAWRAVVVQDILLKLLLMTRPYEVTPGDTDKVYLEALDTMEAIIAEPALSNKDRMVKLKAGLSQVKTAFAAIPVKQEDRPLIGVVGEIFCRLNTFSNNELLRHIEAQGGECWLTGIGEWVLYTNNEAFRRLREEKRRVSKEWLRTFLTYRIMHKDEKALHGDFHHIFARRPEPSVAEVLKCALPYLPQAGSLGEMVLSTGGAIAYYQRGADGIVDISPFTCMNGIITEAVYPRVSKDHDHIPIRVFYFDGTQSDLDRDVGIFLELAKTYKRRKKITRR